MKSTIVKIIIGISAVGVVGTGGYIAYQKINGKENSNSVIEQTNKMEIKAQKKLEFSDEKAWVLGEDNTYYCINKDGKAEFSILAGDNNSEERITDVGEFRNGYSIITCQDDKRNEYKKIIDKDGNIVLEESSSNNIKDSLKILTDVDNIGYVLVNKQGDVKAIDLKTGEEKTKIREQDISTLELKSVGSGVFYNRYIGYILGKYGSVPPYENLEIFEYNATLNKSRFNEVKYIATEFIDGKALFIEKAALNGDVYVVDNEGGSKQLTNLRGYKIGYEISGKHVMKNTYNGKTFYAENTKTKDKGFFDLEGNKVWDLSEHDNILELTKIVNNRVLIIKKTEELNKDEVIVLDKENGSLFEPIKVSGTGSIILSDELFTINSSSTIYNMKGEIVATSEQYENASGLKLTENGIINVYSKNGGVEKYLNSQLQEIIPVYAKGKVKNVERKINIKESNEYKENKEEKEEKNDNTNISKDENEKEESKSSDKNTSKQESKYLKQGKYIQIEPSTVGTVFEGAEISITFNNGTVTKDDPTMGVKRTGTYTIDENKMIIIYNKEKMIDDYTGNYIDKNINVKEEYSVDDTKIYKEYTSENTNGYIAGTEIYEHK